jgi:hypothetical protein
MTTASRTGAADDRYVFADLYEAATGKYPHAIFGRRIRLATEPLQPDERTFEQIYAVHESGWPRGLAPTREALRSMVARDRIFVAYDHARIVAVVHARMLGEGSSVRACAIALDQRTERAATQVVTDTRAIVCHAAVAHIDYRRGGITQRLLTEFLLPYLCTNDDTRGARWMTSSPLTYFVEVGRVLVQTHGYLAAVALLDQNVARVGPAGFRSLRDLIEAARPLGADASGTPADVLSRLYRELPTHDELISLRAGRDDLRQRALETASRATTIGRFDDTASDPRAVACFLLHYFAVALTQAGAYDPSTGRPIDPILRFHMANGGALHDQVGPIPESRPQDIAALMFGQIIVYDPSWEHRREQHRELAERRRQRAKGPDQRGEIDLDQAEPYLGAIVERAAAITRGSFSDGSRI